LIVPNTASDQELLHLRNSLPDSVTVQRVEERLSALGNCISCNDHVALVHPDLDRVRFSRIQRSWPSSSHLGAWQETEEILADVLGVEVFRTTIASNVLVGSYCKFTNRGGLVHPRTAVEDQRELCNLLGVRVLPFVSILFGA
jgi:translation initiation factor 6